MLQSDSTCARPEQRAASYYAPAVEVEDMADSHAPRQTLPLRCSRRDDREFASARRHALTILRQLRQA